MTTVNDMLRPEPKRDRWGRYLITNAEDSSADAKAHTRATTWAKTLEDTYNLEAWGSRMIALGMAARPDILAGVSSCTMEDKQELNRLCRDAKEAAGAGARARVGTALHRITQRVDVGEEFDVPPMFQDDLAAYRMLLAENDIEIVPELVERIVVVPEFTVAGTFDRIVRHQGQLKVADLKTGDSVDYAWLAIAIQLALYANASTMYDPIDEVHYPMPDVSKTEALVFHVPANCGTADLYKVDLTVGWEAAQICGRVRALRNHHGLAEHIVLEPATGGGANVTSASSDAAAPAPVEEAQAAPVGDPPVSEPASDEQAAEAEYALELADSEEAPRTLREWVVDRLQAIIDAGHAPDVAKRWPQDLPTLKTKPDHSDEELDRIVAILWEVEGLHQMTFPDEDPRRVAEREVERAEALIREAYAGTVDVSDSDAPASKEDCDAVVFSLKQMAPEALAKVQEFCMQQDVPNLRSGKATTRHLNIVLEAMDAAEEAPSSDT